MSEDQRPRPGQQLKTLLREAQLASAHCSFGQRLVAYPGTYRDWTFAVTLSDDWLLIGSFVCKVPDAPNLKAELYEAILRINQEIALAKFSVADGGVRLEAEYRAEHVNADTVGYLFGLMVATAEEHYPRLFRIASGDALLKALDFG